MQAEVTWSLLSCCQPHLPVGSVCSVLAHPVLPPQAAPSLSWVSWTSLCQKSLCKELLPNTHSLGDEKSCITTSSSPHTSSSHLAAHVSRTACSHMLTALVPKGHGDGGSPCHGNHHHGTQHLHSPGNVPTPAQTGLENSRVLARKKQSGVCSAV